MAVFASVSALDMGELRNVFSTGQTLAELFTAVATNGASTASYGAVLDMPERDDKYLIAVYNSDATTVEPAHTAAAADVTIKAGNDKVFGSGNDLVLTDLAAGDYAFIKIDSGRFKNSAENTTLKTLTSATTADRLSVKGKLVVLGENAYIKVALIKMPM